MSVEHLHILLADDDLDDCIFFKDALDELPVDVQLAVLHNGEQLLTHLTQQGALLPDVLFIDLNMPRKNGYECLSQIKHNEILKNIPVVIYSTSFERGATTDLLFNEGAYFYVRKPAVFSELKKVIHHILRFLMIKSNARPLKEDFIITTGTIHDIK